MWYYIISTLFNASTQNYVMVENRAELYFRCDSSINKIIYIYSLNHYYYFYNLKDVHISIYLYFQFKTFKFTFIRIIILQLNKYLQLYDYLLYLCTFNFTLFFQYNLKRLHYNNTLIQLLVNIKHVIQLLRIT